MTAIILISLMALSGGSIAQDTLSLQYCYEKAEENYPAAKKIELQKKVTALNLKIANTGLLPEVNLGGKASYQSEVPRFNFPGGGGAPTLSKDQYEAAIDFSQNLFNGGAVGIRKDLEEARGNKEISSVRVELHKLRAQIDQVYYGILLSRQQAKQTVCRPGSSGSGYRSFVQK